MIAKVKTNYINIACFQFVKDLNKEDYEYTVYPAIKYLQKEFGEINMVYIIDTELNQFTMGGWLYEVSLEINELGNFNRIAVLAPNDRIHNFTELFHGVMPGKFRSFEKLDKERALEWASTGK